MAVSNKPWSSFSEADYSIEQYHRASLIHRHTNGATSMTSKGQDALPVREPSGALNRNGVHAAAAALAGARGGVNASSQMKRGAAQRLIGLYRELDEEPPESVRRMAK